MEARDVLKRPVITEKSSEAMAEDKYIRRRYSCK